jgi:hypothetical protein
MKNNDPPPSVSDRIMRSSPDMSLVNLMLRGMGNAATHRPQRDPGDPPPPAPPLAGLPRADQDRDAAAPPPPPPPGGDRQERHRDPHPRPLPTPPREPEQRRVRSPLADALAALLGDAALDAAGGGARGEEEPRDAPQ